MVSVVLAWEGLDADGTAVGELCQASGSMAMPHVVVGCRGTAFSARASGLGASRGLSTGSLGAEAAYPLVFAGCRSDGSPGTAWCGQVHDLLVKHRPMQLRLHLLEEEEEEPTY